MRVLRQPLKPAPIWKLVIGFWTLDIETRLLLPAPLYLPEEKPSQTDINEPADQRSLLCRRGQQGK